MKQLLFPLLFLPAFALAQYPGNANQKITLGEQTTADGLIFRGVAADTTLTVKSDTAAYFVLDTVNLNLYTYKASASGRKWRQLGADTAAIAYVNTYGTQTVNGAKTFTSALTATRFNLTGTSTTGNGMYLPATNTLGFSTNGTKQLEITSTGAATFSSSVTANGISSIGQEQALKFQRTTGTASDVYSFNADSGSGYLYNNTTATALMVWAEGGTVTINNLSGSGSRTVLADANGLLSAPTSSIVSKENVQVLNYGLNEILQINPVSFDYIDKNKWGEERNLGFIVEDMYPIVPEVTGTMNNGDMYLDMVKLIPILTKAIQEQQALIKALEQRIINLENK